MNIPQRSSVTPHRVNMVSFWGDTMFFLMISDRINSVTKGMVSGQNDTIFFIMISGGLNSVDTMPLKGGGRGDTPLLPVGFLGRVDFKKTGCRDRAPRRVWGGENAFLSVRQKKVEEGRRRDRIEGPGGRGPPFLPDKKEANGPAGDVTGRSLPGPAAEQRFKTSALK